MAVQVSYPGVYVDEFEPGAPIEGVGTNTAVFLGIAETGPRNVATRISSWDAFVSTFGGFLTDDGAWLAQGVYGFFTNGGTTCYVVRVSSAQTGTAQLPARKSGNSLTATAVAEGPAGNNIAVTVTESSRSDAAVQRAMTRTITAVSEDRKTLTVAGGVSDIVAGSTLTVTRGADSVAATVDSVSGTDTVVLTAALAGATDFTGGSLTASFVVRVLVASAGVTAVSADRTVLTLDAADSAFAVGDSVLVSKDADSAQSFVTDHNGVTLTVAPPLSGGSDFTGGSIRSADLPDGTRRLRLIVPSTLSLTAAIPPGSLLAVTPDGQSASYVRVSASGGDAVQLDSPGLGPIALTDQTHAPTVATADFDLRVHDPANSAAETFTTLSMDARSPSYWANVVDSAAVTLAMADPLGEAADDGDDRPQVGTVTTAGGQADDRAQSWNDLNSDPNTYLGPLARLHDVSLIAIPGVTGATVTQALIAHCETLQDRFAVLDCAPGLDSTGVMDQFAQVRSARGYAALYYPRMLVTDPTTGAVATWPTSGHITGVYARTDADRGVHKAPANTTIRGALGLETTLSDTEQGPLNLLGINVLRVFPGQSQPVVWGARTTAGDLDRNWQYVNVRRLFIYLEQSIEVGIRWAVFEPNDLSLWQKLKRSIGDFLTQAWRDGALFGAKASDAFYVRIDEALNPPSTRALGRLYIEVGVAPTYPAEFIVLRIGIWNGGSDVSTS
jgi:hypothetical protein